MARLPSAIRSLVDQFGKAIKRTEVEGEKLGPSLTGVRPVISGHPAEGLTPAKLSRIHRSAAEGEPLEYLELAEDIEERDLHYAGVLGTRKRSVAQLPIVVEAASDDPQHKKHADYVQSWIKDEVLAASLFDMLDALGKGFSVMEVDWRYHLGHMCPRDFIWRPQRWFTFDRDDGETVTLRISGEERFLQPHKFIVHRHKSKSGLTIRSGLARIASWAWMYKAFTLRDWAIFVQNYGMPIRIGKYGRNATEDDKETLWRAVAQIAGDCAAIMPADMAVEFVQVGDKGTSGDLFEKRADWMDRQVSKAVLGQTTTTDAVSGGHAVAREHRLVQEDIERADAIVLSATVNRQIVPNLVAFEFGPQDHYPKVRIGRPDEVPLEEFSAAYDRLARHGLTAPAGYLRGRLGIPAPAEDDELVGGRPLSAMDQLFGEPASADKARRDGGRRQLHTRQGSDHVEQLTDRLEQETADVIASMTSEIRAVLAEATDLRDAADRLAKLELSPQALSEAMTQGMAMAHLAGQAALLDDIRRR